VDIKKTIVKTYACTIIAELIDNSPTGEMSKGSTILYRRLLIGEGESLKPVQRLFKPSRKSKGSQRGEAGQHLSTFATESPNQKQGAP